MNGMVVAALSARIEWKALLLLHYAEGLVGLLGR